VAALIFVSGVAAAGARLSVLWSRTEGIRRAYEIFPAGSHATWFSVTTKGIGLGTGQRLNRQEDQDTPPRINDLSLRWRLLATVQNLRKLLRHLSQTEPELAFCLTQLLNRLTGLIPSSSMASFVAPASLFI
jgi:hypothetical protein